MLKYMGPRGLYINIKGCLFLATKAATWLWFGMVIGIDHLHIHNGKFAPYVEVYGPQGPIFEYKGAVFFLAIKATTWLWFGMVICIHHPQHQRYMGGLVQA